MRTIKYTLIQRWPSGHFNPHSNVVVSYRGRSYELESGHGTRDELEVYREGRTVHVVSVNRGLPYCGLASYTLDASLPRDLAIAPDGEVFLQEGHMSEALGERARDLAIHTIRRALEAYINA